MRNRSTFSLDSLGKCRPVSVPDNLGESPYWLYNPLLYRLWKYADLTGRTILMQRLYCFALAASCLVLAHLFFERKSK